MRELTLADHLTFQFYETARYAALLSIHAAQAYEGATDVETSESALDEFLDAVEGFLIASHNYLRIADQPVDLEDRSDLENLRGFVWRNAEVSGLVEELPDGHAQYLATPFRVVTEAASARVC